MLCAACVAAVVFFHGPAVAQAEQRDSSYELALESIQTETVREHVAFLADDAQEGREAGSRGGRACGDYLARQFDRMGLEPAGVEGYFQPFPNRCRNVLARLPGSDPQLANEIILVGAHYDHVGLGASNNSRGRPGEIHNGADDNASGTSGMLELAEAFSLLAERPKRTILFVAWDGEEKGMLGSKHFAAHPTVPIDNIAMVFNLDMIGRMQNDTVYVFGTRSGFGLRRALAECNPGFELVFDWTTMPNADHWPLFDRGIPYLMFHTGKHPQYHTQDDDAARLDHEGIRRLTRFVFATMYDLAQSPRVPGFRAAARHENNWMRGQWTASGAPPAPRLGVRWREPAGADEGVQLTSVQDGTPAAAARLQPGDRILRLGGRDVHSGDELRQAVFHASGPTPLVVHRPAEPEPRTLTAELPRQQLRVGVTWRVDTASPGTVVLTQVLPGSPAAAAGLLAGDRIYQVAGRDFADENEFADRLKHLPGPIELLVERQGRLETIVVRLDATFLDRAA